MCLLYGMSISSRRKTLFTYYYTLRQHIMNKFTESRSVSNDKLVHKPWSRYSRSFSGNSTNNVQFQYSRQNQESINRSRHHKSLEPLTLVQNEPSSHYYLHQFIRHSSSDSSLNRNAFKRFQKRDKSFDVSKGHTGGVRSWCHTPLGSKLCHLENYGRKPGMVFKVMSYNCLCQDILELYPQLYREHNRDTLDWNCRAKNLLEEIRDHNAEILCLQEVQETHLENFYVKELAKLGYKGIFKKRTGNFPDGCALFYKTDRLTVIEHQLIEFWQPNCAFTDRDNVGIIARCAPKDHPNNSFVVATTHLLYNPKREDVRIAQMQILLTELDRFAYTKTKDSYEYLPIILCGDFNSQLDAELAQFLIKGSLPYSYFLRSSGDKSSWLPHHLGITNECRHLAIVRARSDNEELSRDRERELIDIRTAGKEVCGGNECEDRTLFQSGSLRHKFKLSSVYPLVTSEVSTKQEFWKMVDYIYFSKMDGKQTLKLLSRFQLPTASEMATENIPNKAVGSDHFSLIALFKFEF